MRVNGKKIASVAVAAIFKAAVCGSLTAGAVALADSPVKEQKAYPSLSQHDAKSMYHDEIKAFAVLGIILGPGIPFP